MNTKKDNLISVADYAVKHKISKNGAYKRIHTGAVKYKKIGKIYFIIE